MKISSLFTYGLSAAIAGLLAFMSNPANAVNKIAESGNVRAEISYDQGEDAFQVFNLSLKISRGGKVVFNQEIPRKGQQYDRPFFREENPQSWLQDLDGDREPEIIIPLFTGGAHCCVYSVIYRYEPASQQYTYITHDWGDAGGTPSIKDLDNDGIPEFDSGDTRFAYAFTAYAFSAFPPRIWQYRQGRMNDVTRNFPQEIYSHATRLWQNYETRKREYRDDPGIVRGVLAAYLATKYLLGQQEDGWQRLQQAYQHSDRNSFFADLREFMEKTGYIANTSSRLTQETIDRWADNFFYSVNPQLSRRKLRADETLYIREWNAIARVVPDILVYGNNACSRGNQNLEWMLSNYDTQSRNGLNLVSEDLDKIADAIFYVRNPELGGRKIQPGETALANEWLRIRTAVSQLHSCD